MNRKIEVAVGLFIVLVICSLLFLCLRVVDPSSFSSQRTYRIYAIFDNVGGLKEHSPIKIGGVVIGRVNDISLQLTNDNVYKPYVAIDVQSKYNKIPSSSSLMIKTSGLLGERFIDVNLGIDQGIMSDIDALSTDNPKQQVAKTQTSGFFQEGLVVTHTQSAVEIEDLIGQFLYSSNASDTKTNPNPQN